ncbi:TraB family protein [Alkaliphilus metalliredigens QYMF]|uniref:TraB family protein n=1 Tax=Alkaliphilus metalliredigens (strain QYMF) TaxID=293826 RepID=A6TNV7_ALKMQ|nr:TraB/GumN family protein [Alkaliphilus metalliredigens]ABR47875.1 TraB family protein [Alkaliphilus metalliredigens QYMF]
MEENITRIHLNDKEFIIIGTAHVSKQSAEQVKEVIELERPDSVCVELDEQRYQSIMDGNRWRNTDIFRIIKEKKSTLLLVNLLMSSFQKRIAKQFGIQPGQEMIQGIESAKEVEAALVLADRNIQVTFSRIWKNIGLWGKTQLLMQILMSVLVEEEITEEQLEELKSKDMLSSMLDDFTAAFPRLKIPLIDERDQYLAQKMRTAPGNKIIAVLGAAHVPGVTKALEIEHDLNALSQVPPKSNKGKIVSWLIPAFIIALIASTFYLNRSAALDQTMSWVLWNAALSGIGAALAFGHPFSIITAVVVAPLSSLNPLLAAGWFAGIVEAYMRKPNVGDFEDLSDDVFTLKGFWKNKVTRILLVVVLTNLGSTLGTAIGGAEVFRVFLRTIRGA